MNKDRVFVVLVSAICLSFLIYYPLIYLNILPWNTVNLGNIEVPKNFEGEPFAKYQTFVDKAKTKVTNIVNQQMPFYIDILKINTEVNKKLNASLYSLVFGENYEFLPAFHNSTYNTFIEKNNGYIIRTEAYGDYNFKISRTAEIINSLPSVTHGVRIHVYTVSDIGATDILNGIPHFLPSENMVSLLESRLNESINASHLQYGTLEEYRRYFYKTDHHWSFDGSYQGYLDIVELLSKNGGDISPPLPAGEIRTAANVKFRGSLSRSAIEYGIYDEIRDGVPDRPIGEVYINGNKTDNLYANKELYFQGYAPADDFYGHYGNFYHGDYREIHYVFPNDTGRNLLMIADSTSNCMDDLVAAHFDNTYVVDLRMFGDFQYKTFVAENNITDVLFLNLATTMINSFPAYAKNFTE